MQIHLSDISSSEGKSQHYSVAFEMDTITFQQGTFPVLAKEPVEITITRQSSGTGGKRSCDCWNSM